jgi:hypothetical protein
MLGLTYANLPEYLICANKGNYIVTNHSNPSSSGI